MISYRHSLNSRQQETLPNSININDDCKILGVEKFRFTSGSFRTRTPVGGQTGTVNELWIRLEECFQYHNIIIPFLSQVKKSTLSILECHWDNELFVTTFSVRVSCDFCPRKVYISDLCFFYWNGFANGGPFFFETL